MSQLERLRGHAKARLTVTEAADLEGVSLETARDAIKGTKLKWPKPNRHWVAEGMRDPGVRNFMHRLATRLQELKDKHPKDEVCRMTGLNVNEQTRALSGEHNWTFGQIVRLARASGVPYEQILEEGIATSRQMKGIGFGG